MIVVSDSTPLITMMKASQLEVLNRLFGEVLIPEAVFREVTSNTHFKEEAAQIQNSSFIRVVSVRNPDYVAMLQRVTGLDRGESEAIIYADENKVDLLLMDEASGRKVAQNMNLPITGSVGVLIQAVQEHILSVDAGLTAIQKIRRNNRHISERLLAYAERIMNEVDDRNI